MQISYDTPLNSYCESEGSLFYLAFRQTIKAYRRNSNTPYGIFIRKFTKNLKSNRELDPFSHIARFQEKSKALEDESEIIRLRIISTIEVALHYAYLEGESSLADDRIMMRFFAIKAAMFVGLANGYALGVSHNADDDALLRMAKSGAKVRDSKYQPLRDFALAEVAKKHFPSRRNAALTLKPSVLELARELGVYLSEQQAEKTITGWLSDIPFARKRTLSASKDLPSAT